MNRAELLFLFCSLVVFVGWLARDARKQRDELRQTLSRGFAELAAGLTRARPAKRRTAVVMLTGHASKDESGYDTGYKVDLLPGERITVQLFPKFGLHEGATLFLEEPGFYIEEALVGQMKVAEWTRCVEALPAIKVGVVVTVTLVRVEAEP